MSVLPWLVQKQQTQAVSTPCWCTSRRTPHFPNSEALSLLPSLPKSNRSSGFWRIICLAFSLAGLPSVAPPSPRGRTESTEFKGEVPAACRAPQPS